jgi:hypothetical protein
MININININDNNNNNNDKYNDDKLYIIKKILWNGNEEKGRLFIIKIEKKYYKIDDIKYNKNIKTKYHNIKQDKDGRDFVKISFNFLYNMSKRYKKLGVSDDLTQVLYYKFLKLLWEYKPNNKKGASFITYLYRNIIRYITCIFKSNYLKEQIGLTNVPYKVIKKYKKYLIDDIGVAISGNDYQSLIEDDNDIHDKDLDIL